MKLSVTLLATGCLLVASSCAQQTGNRTASPDLPRRQAASPDRTTVERAVEINLNEIEADISNADWERARIKAENLYAGAADRLSAMQAARLTTLYISLASEPGLNFEQLYAYACRIVSLHDQALRLDRNAAERYFASFSADMIREAYENSLYIIRAKDSIGADSTFTTLPTT